MGKDQQHLKLVVSPNDSAKPINCLAWRRGFLADQISIGEQLDINVDIPLDYEDCFDYNFIFLIQLIFKPEMIPVMITEQVVLVN